MTTLIEILDGMTLAEYASGGVHDSFNGCNDLRDRVGLDVTELRRALREYWLALKPHHEVLGEMFAGNVLWEVDAHPGGYDAVKAGAHPDEYIDANMAMHWAWQDVGFAGPSSACDGDEDGMTDAECALWNAAYGHGLSILWSDAK